MAEEKKLNNEQTENSSGEENEVIVENIPLSAEQVDELIQQLESAQLEADENKDNWLRTQAEFINYKKRIEREQLKMYENAAGRVIKRFLDVLDDLDRALQNKPEDGSGAEWAGGVDLIYRKLLTILENEGVTVMEVLNHQFDPNLHEAIAQEESPDHESGQIIEVLQQGYLIGERVLRPALVRVAS